MTDKIESRGQRFPAPVHDIYDERIRFHTRDQLAGWVTQNSSSINVLIQGFFQYFADFEYICLLPTSGQKI